MLSIATEGDPATGDLVFLLTDPADARRVRRHGRRPRARCRRATSQQTADRQDHRGRRLHGPEHRPGRRPQRGHRAFSVPTDRAARSRARACPRAFEGSPRQTYDEACDCITDAATGADLDRRRRRTACSSTPSGESLAQGWKVNVGFSNFADVLTDPTIAASFLQILVWNFAFAILVGRAHLRARPAGRDGAQQRAAQGPADLPVAADPAVRDAGVRDAAGLAGHVQHRLRPDQPAVRPRRQLVRQAVAAR